MKILSIKNFIGSVIAVIIIAISYLTIEPGNLFYFISVIALIIAVFPFVLSIILLQGRQQEKEEKFLEFTRDLVESVKSGTPINKAIMNLQGRDYGALSMHIRKLANQVAIGISLNVSLRNFGRETKSPVISRAVTLIYEAQRAGGDITAIVESVSNSVNQIEGLRKDRMASISNLAVQGYIIFMVFISIMLILEFAILPMVSEFAASDVGNLNVKTSAIENKDFSQPLFLMLIVQSIFAGLVIGKIAEGSLKDGIKHSFSLLGLTLIIVTGIRALLG
jgi:flagellar protein FlaJ